MKCDCACLCSEERTKGGGRIESMMSSSGRVGDDVECAYDFGVVFVDVDSVVVFMMGGTTLGIPCCSKNRFISSRKTSGSPLDFFSA